MKNYQLPASTALPTELLVPGAASALEVNICTDLASVDVMHHGRKITIMRNQNQSNSVNPDFAKTSRKCSSFCIQPGELAPGVKTTVEFEVLKPRVDHSQAIVTGAGFSVHWPARPNPHYSGSRD